MLSCFAVKDNHFEFWKKFRAYKLNKTFAYVIWLFIQWMPMESSVFLRAEKICLRLVKTKWSSEIQHNSMNIYRYEENITSKNNKQLSMITLLKICLITLIAETKGVTQLQINGWAHCSADYKIGKYIFAVITIIEI